MAFYLTHRLRGLALLMRSYRIVVVTNPSV